MIEKNYKESSLKVLITTNIPSPYMVNYLAELSKYCNVTVVFEISEAKDREASWYGSVNENSNLRFVYLHGIKVGNESGLSLGVFKYLSKKKFDRVIIANPTTPTGILSLLYCRWFHVPFIIQSEGGFQGTGKGFKEKFKKYIMEKAQFYLTGMGSDRDYFLSYGATKERLRKYPFSSLYEKDISDKIPSVEEKLRIREKLGIKEKNIVLSVGRFIKVKGFDILIRCAQNFDDDVGFYFVGGEATEEYIDLKNKLNLKNIHFIGFKNKNELSEYYKMADLFVLPTRSDTWGLVINEAMSFGLPVVTTEACIAGLELIKNDVNGYIVPVDNVEVFSDRMAKILNDESLKAEMASNNLNKIKEYTYENMAKNIYKHLGE